MLFYVILNPNGYQLIVLVVEEDDEGEDDDEDVDDVDVDGAFLVVVLSSL